MAAIFYCNKISSQHIQAYFEWKLSLTKENHVLPNENEHMYKTNLNIHLGFAPRVHHFTVMVKVTRCGELLHRVKKVTTDIFWGLQGNNCIKEAELPFCLEIWKENIPLLGVILPLSYCYIIFKTKKSLNLTQFLSPCLSSNWMLSVILIMLIY